VIRVAREERPTDDEYYERERVSLFSQGDLFRDVPLDYPTPPREIVVDEDAEEHGVRAFLSGPLEFGPALLTTPTCSMRAQRADGYAHPVRTLVPVVPLEQLVKVGVVREEQLAFIRKYDPLINYMYLPPLETSDIEFSMPESMALLYMPLTIHHDLIEGNRVSQLAVEGAKHLHRKLVHFASGWLEPRDFFDPPLD
jgi:hypothetical protein